MSESASPRKYKIVFLGEPSVGKTSLITRFMYDTFDATYQPTLGIDYLAKNVYLGDRTVKLQLWDTAGQERFRCLIPSYIRDSAVAFIVYDITNAESFQQVPKWCEYVQQERGKHVQLVFVGNKMDLADKRQVTTEEADRKATEWEALFMETSAKSSHNVKTLFRRVSEALPGIKSSDTQEAEVNVEVSLTESEPRVQKSSWCC